MEPVLRVTVIFLFVMIGLRLLGKREFGQLSPFELVTLLLIPEIASQSLVGTDFSMVGALVGLSTLFLLVFLTSVITHKSRRAQRIVASQPTVLVSQGAFATDNMNRERVSADEVFSEMHKVGLHRLEQVRWAILESDGRISLIPVTPFGPVGHPDPEPVT
jgi:uncharacterized membrane protein YcaP (DUF421 family)